MSDEDSDVHWRSRRLRKLHAREQMHGYLNQVRVRLRKLRQQYVLLYDQRDLPIVYGWLGQLSDRICRVLAPPANARVWIAAVLCGTTLMVSLVLLMLWSGGGDPVDWNVGLLPLGAAGLAAGCWLKPAVERRTVERVAIGGGLLLPLFVALQLLPLPLWMLGILDPMRAEVARSLAMVGTRQGFVPFSLFPPSTWMQLLHVAGYAVVFLVARELSRRTRRAWLPIAPLVVLGVWQATIALLQHAASAQVVSGSYANKNHLAGFLEMVLPLAAAASAAFFVRSREGRAGSPLAPLGLGAAFAAASLMMLVAIAFSLSKAGLLAAICSLGLMAVLAIGAGRSAKAKLAYGFGTAALLATLLFALPPDALVRNLGASTDDPTAEGRWPIARNTLAMAHDYPLVGTGLGTYYPALLRYQTAGTNVTWVYAHNDYLQFLSELGIVGFLLGAILVGGVATVSWRALRRHDSSDDRWKALGVLGSMTAIGIHSFADFNLYVPANAMTFAWLLGFGSAYWSTAWHAGAAREGGDANTKSLRPHLLGLSAVSLVYACAWLVFMNGFTENVAAERAFCRFGICNPFGISSVLQHQYGDDISAVPVSELQRLLARDPAGGYRWLDLAEALQRRGDQAGARYAFARALTLGPHIPFFAIRAAQSSLKRGDYDGGLDLSARAIAIDPSFAPLVFANYRAHHAPVERVLARGIPDPALARRYLGFLIGEQDLVQAEEAWRILLARGWADDESAAKYAQALVAVKRDDAAARSWADYSAARCGDYLNGNYVYNGGFELETAKGPFDWRLSSGPGVAVVTDETAPFEGARSVHVAFDGSGNVTAIPLSQMIFVPPGRFRLQARIRSGGLTTDQGVFLSISGGGLDLKSEPVSAAGGWRLVEAEVDIPPHAELLQIQLRRNHSWKFDNQIAGSIWIDNVALIPES